MNPADTTLANILLAVLARIDALDGAMQAQAAQLQLLIDQQQTGPAGALAVTNAEPANSGWDDAPAVTNAEPANNGGDDAPASTSAEPANSGWEDAPASTSAMPANSGWEQAPAGPSGGSSEGAGWVPFKRY